MSVVPILKKSEFLSNIEYCDDFDISDVVLISTEFDIDSFGIDLFPTYEINCPIEISNAVVKRQAEFLAGRYVAKMAVERVGGGSQDIAIGKNRAPVWPTDILGSISHTGCKAMCAVALSSRIAYLGMDMETIISSEVISEIQEEIIIPDESEVIVSSGLPYNVGFTLAFSAKESLFKALHPFVNEYFDFKSVVLRKIDLSNSAFEFVTVQSLSSHIQTGLEVRGNFQIKDNRVLTCVFQHRCKDDEASKSAAAPFAFR